MTNTTAMSKWMNSITCSRNSTGILHILPRRLPKMNRRLFTSTGTAQNNPSTSQQGARLFFEWLEGRFGGHLPMASNTPDNPQVVIASHLTAKDLQRLFRHEITVLQVRNFYPKASAIQLGRELAQQSVSQRHHQNGNNEPQQQQQQQQQVDSQLLKNWKVSTARGLESSDVFTLGAHLPYNIAIARGDDGVEEYFNNVPTEFRERRRQKFDREDDENDEARRLWPLDQLRLELDEIWPHGAGLAKEKRRKGKSVNSSDSPIDSTRTMGGGLPRIMMGPTRWRKGFVHVDELAPLSTDSGLFTANIYLQLPSSSSPSSSSIKQHGCQEVLEIWALEIKNRWDWYRNAKTLSYLSSQDAEGQVVLRRALRMATISGKDKNSNNDNGSLRVTVEPGDLVLFCAQRPHCAIGFDSVGTVRVSLQVFCQYEGPNKRLSLEG